MKKSHILFVFGIVATASGLGLKWGRNKPATASQQTDIIIQAATGFLNSLDQDQRQKILFDFEQPGVAKNVKFARTENPGSMPNAHDNWPEKSSDKNAQQNGHPPGDGAGRGKFPGFVGEQYGKAVWSNFPVSDVSRPGIQMGSLTTMQHEAASDLLQALLSEMGYEKILAIMGSDQALADAGTNFASGRDRYTLAIFGTPGKAKPWMVEFGGHHLALNIVIAGVQGTITPMLTGSQPSVYESNGKKVRVLAAENDKAFDLINTFTESQKTKAILNYQVGDLVLGPGHDGEVIVPEGLKGSNMDAKQKEMMIDLISQWASVINNVFVEKRMNEIKAGIDDTYFAWSGPLTHQPGGNGSSYYRIQGPHVIIEFSPQGVGGDPTMHVHTIYRDPGNEYGTSLLK